MKKLAKRNKINVFGQSLLYTTLCLVSLIVLWLFSLIFLSDEIIISAILGSVMVIIMVPIFIKNLVEFVKILKLINSMPEYYLEINNGYIEVNALDKKYLINFKDIKKLNYSYDKPLIASNLLTMYGNHKYKLNTNSEIQMSNYTMFDLSSEFVQGLKTDKKTKHGLLLITTKEHFFVLPEIENVEECFNLLKQLVNYTPIVKESESKENAEFVEKIYSSIVESNKDKELEYNEKKFIALTNMLEMIYDFELEENIKYLEELNATNYVTLLNNIKSDINKVRLTPNPLTPEDIAVEIFNRVKILNEIEPFYKLYLIPFAKENLSKYIK